jgi:hypothetical protein
MIDYGTVYSSIRPNDVKIDDYSVWVSTDIKEIDEDGFVSYSFLQKRYTKDEYIKLLGEENGALSTELTNTQLALCELYEGMM